VGRYELNEFQQAWLGILILLGAALLLGGCASHTTPTTVPTRCYGARCPQNTLLAAEVRHDFSSRGR